MEDFVISVLIIQGISALAVLVGCAADALVQRKRQPGYWAAPPAPAFPESVYDRQDAVQDSEDHEAFPRAA